MKIAIDFFSTCKIVDGIAKYTGGGNYAKQRLLELKKIDIKLHEITLLVPCNYVVPEEDYYIFEGFDLLYINDLKKIDYSDIDILYLPQVNGSVLLEIVAIKKKKSSLKIIATLHDRQHNILKYDKYDRYYASGIRKLLPVSFLLYFGKKIAFNLLYSKCIKFVDKVITVSNYSMQQLNDPNVSFIKYYLNNNVFVSPRKEILPNKNYCLFVGGDRPDKNLIRTLEAFCLFKRKHNTDIKMIVTGISKHFKQHILKLDILDDNIINMYVQFYDYVSYSELARLYAESKYVVFMSKCEGFGLPVKEALYYGKAILASNTTSIPEVAGSSAYYVNPFNVQSIVEGFKAFESDCIIKHYENSAHRRYEILEQIHQLDKDDFFFDFFY